jgi:Tol biopolymer transport system component
MHSTTCFMCHTPLRPDATVCRSCGLLLVVKGRFTLYSYHNQGGFGIIYKAHDLQQPGVDVAVKVVPYESQGQLDQALQEVAILRRHKLTFIPYFYAMERYADSVYIVTEFINGTTLGTYQRGFWSPNRVEQMVYLLLGYLIKLHERGIVHRDLSPSNIMHVGGDPAQYVLLDFGIAKEGTSTVSAMRQAGNPGFVAPEQLRGQTSTQSCDLYSLGATAYSLLTGRMPTTMERLAGVRLERPSDLVPGVSPILDEMLLWLLQLDPARRPSSAAAARAWMNRRYRPVAPPKASGAGLGWAAAIMAIALFVTIWFFGSRPASGNADPGRVVFTSSRTGTYELYVADGAEALPSPLAALPGDEFAPTWSSDGERVAYVRLLDGNHDIYRVNVDGTENLPVAASPATEATPAWSPDGQRVAFSSNHSGNFEIYTVAADGVGGWEPVGHHPGVDRSPVWTSDGQIISIAQREQGWGLYQHSLADHSETLIYQGTGEIFTLARAHDGKHLAFAMRDATGNADIYTVASDGQGLQRLTTDPAEDAYPSWSPDGSRLIFQSKRDNTGIANAAQLYMVNADGTGEARVSQGSDDDRQPAWRPRAP